MSSRESITEIPEDSSHQYIQPIKATSHVPILADCALALQTFSLEKYSHWWLWNGYLTLTCYKGADMCIDYEWGLGWPDLFQWKYDNDDDNPQTRWVDDPLSFPSLKPDIDVYGVPHRSRKQRGWYHVHRLPCVLCVASHFWSGHPPISISDSAADALPILPAEIIHRIVCNRELVRTQIAVVCKYWARICLGADWAPVGLHSRAHIMALRSLAASPCNYLTRTITQFTVLEYALDRADDPWLHLLPSTRKALPRCASGGPDYVTVTGPLGKGLRTMRSIHAYLPRRLPAAFSNNLQHLTLCGIRFHRLGDLVDTLGELKGLRVFWGTKLTWTDSETSPVLLHSRTNASPASCTPAVRLEECARNEDALSLVRASGYYCVQLRAVLQSLVWSKCAVSVQTVSKPSMELWNGLDNLFTTRYRIDIKSSCSYQLRAIQTWQPLSPVPLHVKLNMRFSAPPHELQSVDWKAFDKSIVEYGQVQSLVIGRYRQYPWRDFKDGAWIPMDGDDMQFIIDSLPSSYAAGKVLFTRPVRGEWDVREE